MKVIDLLNKIANGEHPIIKDGTNYYVYNAVKNDYITGMGYNYEHYFSNINILEYLNEEVEIIEETKIHEEKKIPDIIIPTLLKGIDDLDEKIEIAHLDTISAIGTINEIIKYLKEKELD